MLVQSSTVADPGAMDRGGATEMDLGMEVPQCGSGGKPQ